VRRSLTIALLGLALLIALPAAADAHALVRSSEPPDGAVLQESPARVVITFTELPDPKLSLVRVLDSSGNAVGVAPSRAVPGQPLELEVPLRPSLPDGVYTITWRTVSRVDGHVTGGSLTFGLGVTPPEQRTTSSSLPTTPPPPPLSVAGRWMFYWGLAVLLGAEAMTLFVRNALPPGGRLLLVAAWLVAAMGLVAMTLAEASTVGTSLARLLTSGTGLHFVERAVAIALVGALILPVFRRPGRANVTLLGAATAGAMLVHVLAGHAGASGGLRWLDVTVQWGHVLAVGVWIGGLVWLLLALRMMDAQDRPTVVRQFSWMAGWALAIVGLTGLLRALDELGWPDHWGRLFDTSFGLALLIKVGLFLALVALGAVNRYRNVPRVEAANPGMRSLRLTVRGEVLVAALIFAATAVMSELPPSATVAAASKSRRPPQLVVTGSDFATTVRARLTVTPGTVGPNRFTAVVQDFDTGQPIPASSVTLTFSLSSRPNLGTPTVSLRREGASSWTGQATTLSMYGTWDVQLLAQGPRGGATVPFRLTPRLPSQNVTVSTASGQPTLYTIALPQQDSLQAYVDPGTSGNNTVHFTFFQASGNELPIASATATSVPPGHDVQDLPLIRFDAGHFVANTSLSPGRWRFVIATTTGGGDALTAYFDPVIQP
jgi:copper transport protein